MIPLLKNFLFSAFTLCSFIIVDIQASALSTPLQRIEEIKELIQKNPADLVEQLKKANDTKYPEDQYVVCFEKEIKDSKDHFKRIVHINPGKVGEEVKAESEIWKIVERFFDKTKGKKDPELIDYKIDNKDYYAYTLQFTRKDGETEIPCVCAVTSLKAASEPAQPATRATEATTTSTLENNENVEEKKIDSAAPEPKAEPLAEKPAEATQPKDTAIENNAKEEKKKEEPVGANT